MPVYHDPDTGLSYYEPNRQSKEEDHQPSSGKIEEIIRQLQANTDMLHKLSVYVVEEYGLSPKEEEIIMLISDNSDLINHLKYDGECL